MNSKTNFLNTLEPLIYIAIIDIYNSLSLFFFIKSLLNILKDTKSFLSNYRYFNIILQFF